MHLLNPMIVQDGVHTYIHRCLNYTK